MGVWWGAEDDRCSIDAIRDVEVRAADYLEAGLAEPAPVAEDADSTSALRYMFDLASVTREQDGTFTLRAPDDSGRTICGAAREQALGVIAARWGAVPSEPAPVAEHNCDGGCITHGCWSLCKSPVAGVSAEERAEALRLAMEARCIANSPREAAIGDAMLRVLAALDAAETRAARAERERDAARGDRSWIRYEYEGGMHTAAELVALAKERHGLKITRAQMVARMYHGWTVEKAIKTPVGRNAAG